MNSENWKKSHLQRFWNEIAPCEHVLQVYENDKVFTDLLEGFVGCGLIAGDSIIIIATPEHLAAIEERLLDQGFDMKALIATNRYIGVEAQKSLDKFMVNGHPNKALFSKFAGSLLQRAQQNNRKVRAFGEMVALLWHDGLQEATFELENLWNELQQVEKFTLLCAYPTSLFAENGAASLDKICAAHTKVIDGTPNPSTEIHYQPALQL